MGVHFRFRNVAEKPLQPQGGEHGKAVGSYGEMSAFCGLTSLGYTVRCGFEMDGVKRRSARVPPLVKWCGWHPRLAIPPRPLQSVLCVKSMYGNKRRSIIGPFVLFCNDELPCLG